MLNNLLANFYERDLRKVIEEVNAFKNEEDMWKIQGTVKNSCGNLVSHLIGGLNHFIGATLAHTGYVRNRDLEFSVKGTPRKELNAIGIANCNDQKGTGVVHPRNDGGRVSANVRRREKFEYLRIDAVPRPYKLPSGTDKLSAPYFGIADV